MKPRFSTKPYSNAHSRIILAIFKPVCWPDISFKDRRIVCRPFANTHWAKIPSRPNLLGDVHPSTITCILDRASKSTTFSSSFLIPYPATKSALIVEWLDGRNLIASGFKRRMSIRKGKEFTIRRGRFASAIRRMRSSRSSAFVIGVRE